MKKIKLIINPSSGRQIMERKIDYLCKLLLDGGFIISKYFTKGKDDATNETIRTCSEDFDLIIACGGDGTVNEVVKGLRNCENRLPLAILATGTVNDFANYMNITSNITNFYNMIKEGKTIDVDIGKVRDRYFVNVAAGGLLTNVGYLVQPEAKAILGRMAYYFEGIRELALQNYEPIKVKIESDQFKGEMDILLFVVSNSSSIGGFKNLAPEADVLDGLLDVVIVKKSGTTDLASIFFNIFSGEHVNHPNVLYFKTKSISISSNERVPIDLDGEYGGILPATFEVVPKGLKLMI